MHQGNVRLLWMLSGRKPIPDIMYDSQGWKKKHNVHLVISSVHTAGVLIRKSTKRCVRRWQEQRFFSHYFKWQFSKCLPVYAVHFIKRFLYAEQI